MVWEAVLRWIDFDPKARVTHLARLMRGIRLGLLANSVRILKHKILI